MLITKEANVSSAVTLVSNFHTRFSKANENSSYSLQVFRFTKANENTVIILYKFFVSQNPPKSSADTSHDWKRLNDVKSKCQ